MRVGVRRCEKSLGMHVEREREGAGGGGGGERESVCV